MKLDIDYVDYGCDDERPTLVLTPESDDERLDLHRFAEAHSRELAFKNGRGLGAIAVPLPYFDGA